MQNIYLSYWKMAINKKESRWFLHGKLLIRSQQVLKPSKRPSRDDTLARRKQALILWQVTNEPTTTSPYPVIGLQGADVRMLTRKQEQESSKMLVLKTGLSNPKWRMMWFIL